MLVLKIHALAQGFSGIRLETLERILWMLENEVIPVVPEQLSRGIRRFGATIPSFFYL